MKSIRVFVLASAVAAVAASGAGAADLPTNKAPPPPPAPPSCFASFWNWFSASADQCPLSYMGITLYGQVDVGGGYATNASRFNPNYPNGVSELINKFNNGGRWIGIPSGLSQSNVGIKIKEEFAPGWSFIADANAGFDPYSLQFANGPRSLVDNNFNTLVNQTANGDSSRTWGIDNTRAYAGVSNTTFGTLTFGRQYSFSKDFSSTYDPFGGAYAFSLLGTTGTVVEGLGDTELARYNLSAKYVVNYNGFRFGAITQTGGWSVNNNADEAFEFDLGDTFGGLSIDGVYSYAKDAVALSSFGGGAIPAGDPSDTLKATLADINAGVVAAKYNFQALTLYGGYEYINFSNPSDPHGATAAANGDFVSNLNGGYPAVIQKFAYPNDRVLQVFWTGAKYGIRPDLDIAGGWYHEWQNNYSAAGTNCGANTTPAAAGFSPQGSASSQCHGATDVLSAMLDYRPVKRLDIYGGVMYSIVSGGMANGYLHSTNVEPMAGVRLTF